VPQNSPYMGGGGGPPGPPILTHPGANGSQIQHQLLMAAAAAQDRPLPPSFGPSGLQPLNPLFMGKEEPVSTGLMNSRTPSVSPERVSTTPPSSIKLGPSSQE
jgi:hypothetical protein